MGQLNVGEIRTEAEVETDQPERTDEKPRPGWEQRALFRLLEEQVRCEAMRTAAFGNED